MNKIRIVGIILLGLFVANLVWSFYDIGAGANTGTITIASVIGGTTEPTPGSYTFNIGDPTTITAIASNGYAFTYWDTPTGMSVQNPLQITVASGTSIYTPHFTQIVTTQGTIVINALEGGSTSPSPGAHDYPVGTVVELTATPKSGYVFVSWTTPTGLVSQNILQVTVASGVATYTANFALEGSVQGTVIIVAGIGGTTTPNPGSYSFNVGAVITLTATPSLGYSFSSWTTPTGPTTSNPIIVTVPSGASTYMVNFLVIPPQKGTIQISTTTGGTTEPAPGSYTYDVGASVTLTAIVTDSTYAFNYWLTASGQVTTNPYTVTVATGTSTYQAVFLPSSSVTNLFPNPSVEDGATGPRGWAVSLGNAVDTAWVTTDAHSGIHSLQINPSPTSAGTTIWSETYYYTNPEWYPYTWPYARGHTYYLRGWFKTTHVAGYIGWMAWNITASGVWDTVGYGSVKIDDVNGAGWVQSGWCIMTVPLTTTVLGVRVIARASDLTSGYTSGTVLADDFEAVTDITGLSILPLIAIGGVGIDSVWFIELAIGVVLVVMPKRKRDLW